MKSYKVIVTGPVGAGKTTAVQAVTDTAPVSTDTAVSDMTRCRKASTTVAMDYGVLHLEDKTIHIYGTPGQERFDFMWDILISKGDALILLLDHSRNNPYRDMQHYAEYFAKFIRPHNTIIGITHYDQKEPRAIEIYRQWANELNITSLVFFIDARAKQDIVFLITQVLEILNNPPLVHHTPTITQSVSASQTITNTMLAKMSELESVIDLSIINDQGEILHAKGINTIEQETMLLLAQLTTQFEADMKMTVQKVLLKGKHDHNILLFKEHKQALSLVFDKRYSPQLLSQQVEDILQWA